MRSSEKLIAANVTQVAGVVAPDLGARRGARQSLDDRRRGAAAAASSSSPTSATCRRSPRCVTRLAPFAALGYAVVECRGAATTRRRCCRGSRDQHTRAGRPVGHGQVDARSTRCCPTPRARRRGLRRRCAPAATRRRRPTLYRLPALGDDGWIVDSPGMKVFGLAHVAADDARAGVRRAAAVSRALPLSRLPPRPRAGLRGDGGGGRRVASKPFRVASAARAEARVRAAAERRRDRRRRTVSIRLTAASSFM